MRYHHVLRVGATLLAAAATMPAAALQPQLLQHRTITKKLPGTMNPANDVQRIVHLSRAPGALVSIDTTKPDCAFATYPTSPNGLVTFDGTLYARLDCQSSGRLNLIDGDRIDLSPVFAHGFRIDHIVFKDLAAPNHSDGWSREPGRIRVAGATTYPLTTTTSLFDASKVAPWNSGGNDHVLLVDPPRYRKQANSGMHMTDEYRLDIYVVGPAGIDPYTGNRITKAVIN